MCLYELASNRTPAKLYSVLLANSKSRRNSSTFVAAWLRKYSYQGWELAVIVHTCLDVRVCLHVNLKYIEAVYVSDLPWLRFVSFLTSNLNNKTAIELLCSMNLSSLHCNIAKVRF